MKEGTAKFDSIVESVNSPVCQLRKALRTACSSINVPRRALFTLLTRKIADECI